LKNAWPKITTDLPTDMDAPFSREYALWPCLNLLVLTKNPEVLLRLLYHRATNSAGMYQDIDVNSIHGKKDSPFAHFPWACRLSPVQLERLGAIPVLLTNDAPYYTRIAQTYRHDRTVGSRIFNLTFGLKMIEVQAHIYRVLADVGLEIMKISNIPEHLWWDGRVYPRLTPIEPPIDDFQELGGLLQHQYGPPMFDYSRICKLLEAQVTKVTDKLLHLRANPHTFEVSVRNESLLSNPLAAKVKTEQEFDILEEQTWMNSLEALVTTTLGDVDRWTGLRDVCYEIPAVFSPARSAAFLVFNEHVEETIKYFYESFQEIEPGTGPLSSGYFSVQSSENMGAKALKRLHALHGKLILLRKGRKKHFEDNKSKTILSILQRELTRSRCPLNSRVQRLVEGLAIATECQIQATLYMAKWKRILEADRRSRVKMALAKASLHRYIETWKDLKEDGTWKELGHCGVLELGFPRDGRFECPAGKSREDLDVRRRATHNLDKFWKELVYFLEDREAISDLTVRLLRDQTERQRLHRSEPDQAASDDDKEKCPELVGTSLKSLWDETSFAKEEKRRLGSATTTAEATQERLVEPDATGPRNNGLTPPSPLPGPRKILVKRETFDVLRMLWYDRDNGRPSSTLDWSDFARAMEAMGFHFDGGRSGSR
jgi:hypothetical protein